MTEENWKLMDEIVKNLNERQYADPKIGKAWIMPDITKPKELTQVKALGFYRSGWTYWGAEIPGCKPYIPERGETQ